MRHVKELVLGAGISGLSYAYEFHRNGREDVLVCEKENWKGGLCHSFQVDGFWFDRAVHLSFTGDETAREYFDRTKYIRHQPEAYNYYHGRYLKHPVLHNLYPLEAAEKAEYIISFLERERNGTAQNYEEWLRGTYGKKITEDFYEVYTKKYWTVASRELGTSWVGNRLNQPDIRKMLYGALTDETGNDYYASEMRYPEKGRYETFLEPMYKVVKVELNKEAVKIQPNEKWVMFQDGTKISYEHLVSSIAMPDLAGMMEGAPEAVRKEAKELKASKISLVSVGLKRPKLAKYLWMYVYDEEIKAARINAPSLKSGKNAPEGCSSVQFEIYHKPEEKAEPEKLIGNTKKALVRMQICREEDIQFMDYRQIPYGNVIFYQDMEKHREQVSEYIKKQGISLIGRFGLWEYLWSDQSYRSGKSCAEERLKALHEKQR